ncbi:TonB-dependent receptor domain-containing protein [Bacteroides reticulotermitis]|uniref:TonB-dependent receptor domain-containing protein n=1 Tax=Bacteroides reticulotermitis TaxID=1133319 RepID=UPI003A87E053
MKYLGLCMAVFCCLTVKAQQLQGYIFDQAKEPVEGVAVMLQTVDSAFVEGTITDANGLFRLTNRPAKFRLKLQHLAYQTKFVEEGMLRDTLYLEDNTEFLDEVVIKAERPLVRVEDGRLSYDLAALSQRKSISNAYEAIKELPGISESDGALSLAGASSLAVIINGKPTTMTAGQLETLLKSTPVDRIEKAEVMYSAPPQYHVRGAAVNLVMKRAATSSFQGEVKTGYNNQYYSSGYMNGNFRLTTPRYAFDFMYNAGQMKGFTHIKTESNHTLKDKVYEIRQEQNLSEKGWQHDLRGAFEYNLPENGWLSLAYTGSFSPSDKGDSRTSGSYQESHVSRQGDSRMHNVAASYRSGFGLDLNMDYTSYKSGKEQHLKSTLRDEQANSFDLSGEQTIYRYSFMADQKHELANNWKLGYGAAYALVKDDDAQTYSNVAGDLETQNTSSKLEEHTASFYVNVDKKLSERTTFSVSGTGEYYTIGDYHKWSVYPQASLTFMSSPDQIFQFSLSSDKAYPSYWDMQSSITYLDGYAEIHGSPELRPMSSYNVNANYILKRKYIFTLFYTHKKDFFTQAAYQATDRLALIYKTQNWNYMQNWGVNVIVPFKAGSWLDSRFSVAGFLLKEKCDDYFDIPFDRSKYVTSLSLKNNFRVSKHISFDLDASYQSPAIQGTYDIENVFNLTVGGKWIFCGDRATLTLRCTDLLELGTPKATIAYKGQNLIMDSGYYNRRVAVSFSYKFGGYKDKDHKKVDVSRFGH